MLNRKDFILKEKMFDFDKYPELEEVYTRFFKLYKKISNYNNRNKDATQLNKEFDKIEKELSKKVFDTFHGKVDYVLYDGTEKRSWAEMFGDDWDKLDDNHKTCLAWLLEDGYIYRLPDEYYVSPVGFFDRESRK